MPGDVWTKDDGPRFHWSQYVHGITQDVIIPVIHQLQGEITDICSQAWRDDHLIKGLKIKVPEPAANNRLPLIERLLKIQLKAISFVVRNWLLNTTSSLPFKTSASFLEITRSKIWPLLWVGTVTCCFRLNKSNKLPNCTAYLSAVSSMSKLKSPMMSSKLLSFEVALMSVPSWIWINTETN